MKKIARARLAGLIGLAGSLSLFVGLAALDAMLEPLGQLIEPAAMPSVRFTLRGIVILWLAGGAFGLLALTADETWRRDLLGVAGMFATLLGLAVYLVGGAYTLTLLLGRWIGSRTASLL